MDELRQGARVRIFDQDYAAEHFGRIGEVTLHDPTLKACVVRFGDVRRWMDDWALEVVGAES